MKTALVAAALLAASAVVAGCGSTSGSTGRVDVVAGENVWGDVVRQIGGDHVRVTSIISDPNADPHDYESNPDDAAALARADLVVENGVGYDDFLAKLVSASGRHPTVLSVQQVVGAGDDANPHLWYDPTSVTETATAVERQLSTQDPADAPAFAAGLQAFLQAYQPYLDTIAAIRAKHAGTAISYTERVPGYLVQAAGLVLGTPAGFSQAVEDGTDPTPQDTAAFDADIQQRKVAVLLYNSQVTDAQTTKIEQLATSAGVPIVGVSETLPKGETFQQWQTGQARALQAALGG